TGDEIVPPSASPGPGQIRDSNSALIAALASDFGVAIAQSGHAPDDLAAIVAFLQEPADLILLSGGASVGDYDLGGRALEEAGFEVHFRQVNLRPGKPLTFATRENTAAFVLPGNPVSHFVCWHVAVKLALEQFLGLAPRWEFLDLEIFDAELPRPDPRQVFWPAKVVIREGRPGVIPKPWSTSGNTFALTDTNALVRIDGTMAHAGTIPTLLVGKHDLF
ncbi:MAG: molybdopterin-binding protein, partial [Terrimicrobiaceae bacterium]